MGFGALAFVVFATLCVGMFYMAYIPAIQDSLERDARARERRAAAAASAAPPTTPPTTPAEAPRPPA